MGHGPDRTRLLLVFPYLPSHLSYTIIMPRDQQNRYFIRGDYQGRTVSRSSRVNYSRSRLSTHLNPIPYRTTEVLIADVDREGNEWFKDAGQDLHLSNFLFLTRMQTARRMEDRRHRNMYRDSVMTRLLEEGTFDRRDPDAHSTSEENSMAFSAALGNRLLMRIESLESEVCVLACSVFKC